MEIWLFGNPDLIEDSLPFKILPKLKKQFSQIVFKIQDPNEEWNLPNKLYLIDTVKNLNRVKVFTRLDDFSQHSPITMHDFDLAMQLGLLKKLKLLPPIVIFGIPMNFSQTKALEQLIPILHQYLT